MAEYIEREAAIAETRKPRVTDAELRRRLSFIPAADVVPVVRAKWEKRYNSYLKCSNCHEPYSLIDFCGCKQSINFCPNCGARMNVENSVEIVENRNP